MKIIDYIQKLPNAIREHGAFNKDYLRGGYQHFIRYCSYEEADTFINQGNEWEMPIKYDIHFCSDATKIDIFIKCD